MSDVLLKEMEDKAYIAEKDKLVAKANKEKLERQLTAAVQGSGQASQFSEEIGEVMSMLKENQRALKESNQKMVEMIE